MKKIINVLVVALVAVTLAAIVNSPVPLITAIVGGAVAGLASNFITDYGSRFNARAGIGVVAGAITLVGGLAEVIATNGSSTMLFQLFLGLVIGSPIGVLVGQD